MHSINHICAVAVCLVSTGCAFADDSSTTIILSTCDSGKTVKIKAGQSVLVQLPVQRGTGYSWQPPKSRQHSLFVVEQEKGSFETPARPGSKETQAFRLSFKQAGKAEVVFQYRRPWDQNSPPANTFRVKIEAQK